METIINDFLRPIVKNTEDMEFVKEIILPEVSLAKNIIVKGNEIIMDSEYFIDEDLFVESGWKEYDMYPIQEYSKIFSLESKYKITFGQDFFGVRYCGDNFTNYVNIVEL